MAELSEEQYKRAAPEQTSLQAESIQLLSSQSEFSNKKTEESSSLQNAQKGLFIKQLENKPDTPKIVLPELSISEDGTTQGQQSSRSRFPGSDATTQATWETSPQPKPRENPWNDHEVITQATWETSPQPKPREDLSNSTEEIGIIPKHRTYQEGILNLFNRAMTVDNFAEDLKDGQLSDKNVKKLKQVLDEKGFDEFKKMITDTNKCLAEKNIDTRLSIERKSRESDPEQDDIYVKSTHLNDGKDNDAEVQEESVLIGSRRVDYGDKRR